jgi:peptide/nickel transport system ATP-binding protein
VSAVPAVLDVRKLRTELDLSSGPATVVDDVSFHVNHRETVALVGESGCGKSMTALSLMRILPTPPARIAGGQVLLDGEDLLALSASGMQAVRGREIAMIFQDPMTSLNPVMSIGNQIIEAIQQHEPLSRADARRRALEWLRAVRIPDAERRLDEYPHRLSGGMRQRVMIAMALCCSPKLLIADEPTTALDVTIQAQILALLKQLQSEFGTGIVLITHNLGIVADVADRVVVMYGGRIVEEAPAEKLFGTPRHPYTRGLMGATPRFERRAVPKGVRFSEIPGMVPQITDMPPGCCFAPRCPMAMERCRVERPRLETAADGSRVACFAA